jgi:hypothetical protein
MNSMDQRQSFRFQVEASAIMRVHGKPGPFLVTILDVSASGVRVSSSTVFPAGTKVTLTCRKTEMAGEIRYSRKVEGDGTHVGIQVDSVAGSLAESENGELDLVRLFKELIREKAPAARKAI